ncbi:hypothetical protein [Ornithinimicrobium sp. W1665]|uniref:hypothetical protein n=1 Tax=Ornithinimicrobium sp. W1665 TaxID=3416666 RepID=UPI003CF915BF
MNRMLRRGLLATAAGTAAVAMAAGSASAHHCFIPMYNLNGPSSPNWFVVSAEMGASFPDEEGNPGYVAACPGAADAGYAALEEAGLPVGIKIFDKMTIGDPKGKGRMNPNGANGKGLEYFGAPSPLPDQMVATYVAGAESYDC